MDRIVDMVETDLLLQLLPAAIVGSAGYEGTGPAHSKSPCSFETDISVKVNGSST